MTNSNQNTAINEQGGETSLVFSFSEQSTALGSFFQFAGVTFSAFLTLVKDDTKNLESCLTLTSVWKSFLEETQLPSNRIDILKSTLQNIINHETAREEACKEYNRLFIHPDAPVPLWESLWRSNEKILFTQYTLQVRDVYHTFNSMIAKFQYEAEDFLGYELIFAGYLFDKAFGSTLSEVEQTAAQEGLELFFKEHLLVWAPECLKQLCVATENSFWNSLFTVLYIILENLQEEFKLEKI